MCHPVSRLLPFRLRNSHKAEDDGSSEAHEQEEGQGAQNGRDDNHASTPSAGPRVNGRVGNGCRGPQPT